jgi:hypothetical protein
MLSIYKTGEAQMSDETFAATSRRSFLRLSGYLTGGLVLPLAGNKVLALANPAQAETVAVSPIAMPVCDELVKFRSLARGYAALRRETWETYRNGLPGDKPTQEFIVRTVIAPERERVNTQAAAVIARPVTTLADVAALAEVAWLAAPKDDCPVGPRTSRLKRGHWKPNEPGSRDFIHSDHMYYAATAALIEAVLTLAGGQRFDMCFDADA